MLAARSGSTETVTRLVETGADINAKEKGIRSDGADGRGRPRSRRRREAAAGARRRLEGRVVGRRPEGAASPMEDGTGRPQQPAAVQALDVAGVTRGYRYNELIGAQGGLTALHFAARQGSAAAARALVDAGVERQPGRVPATRQRRCWSR